MYCRNCGKKIKEHSAFCSACETKVGDGESFCSRCGTSLTEGETFCAKCGVSLDKEKQKKDENNIEKTASPIELDEQKIFRAYENNYPIVIRKFIYNMLESVVLLLLIFSLLFLPIFQQKIELSSDDILNSNLEEFEELIDIIDSTEELEEAIERGYITKNAFAVNLRGNDEERMLMGTGAFLVCLLFVFIFPYGRALFGGICKRSCKQVMTLYNRGFKYAKTRGTDTTPLIHVPTVVLVVLFIAIVWAVNAVKGNIFIGFSWWMLLPVGLIVLNLFLEAKIRKIKTELIEKIKNDFEDAEERETIMKIIQLIE